MSGDRSSSRPRRGDGDRRPSRGDDRREPSSRGSGGRSSGGRSGGSQGGSGRDGNRSDRRGAGRGGRDEKWKDDRPPLTDADRRSMEVKRRRGRKPEPDLEAEKAKEREKIEARTTEEWVDEGSVRGAARAAALRANADDGQQGDDEAVGRRAAQPLDPEVSAELSYALGAQRGARLAERLAQASEALDRERFDEAKRIAGSIAKEAPSVATAHEIVGLANYRIGRYKQGASALELANELRENPEILPALADCYRALKRWGSVERVWMQIRESSPAHDVLAEGRIVAAGALADRGELAEAIDIMLASAKKTKKVKDHHLRQWYVLGDLYDRLNDPIQARKWFGTVANHAPDFVDVQTRLRHVGK